MYNISQSVLFFINVTSIYRVYRKRVLPAPFLRWPIPRSCYTFDHMPICKVIMGNVV